MIDSADMQLCRYQGHEWVPARVIDHPGLQALIVGISVCYGGQAIKRLLPWLCGFQEPAFPGSMTTIAL